MNRDLLRQAQKLQAQFARAQEELEKATVEASAGGGAVVVKMSGQHKLLSVKISPEVINPQEAELLEDLVLTAVNEAIKKVQEMAASRLGPITGGFKVPGLM